MRAALPPQDWPAAVSLLQEASARLARDSLTRVSSGQRLLPCAAGCCHATCIAAQAALLLGAALYTGFPAAYTHPIHNRLALPSCADLPSTSTPLRLISTP